MIRIGFIHFDGLHIIPHFIGSLVELYNDSECEVDVLVPEIEHNYLNSLLDKLNIPKSIIKKLPTYTYKKIAYKIQKRGKPSNQYIFKKHKDLLFSYDVLVFNVFNHMHIERPNRNKPKYVFLMHGSGDGDHPYLDIHKKPLSEFDLITTSGQKINDKFKKLGEFPNTKFEICGYQKIDIVKLISKRKKFFNNHKPIVLYNPHFKKPASSFHNFGITILDFFYNNKDYNLIFAPHSNLFDKNIRESLNVDLIEKKYYNSENIKIDLGSVNSVDMSYTIAADIYLGDVSSQVHEFLLYDPRPCVFINSLANNGEKETYYQNWNLGKVITDVNELDTLLKTSDIWQKDYKEKQIKAIKYTFDISEDISSSKRVANAIKRIVE